MKKMQCETCGSIYVKKIDEDLFECQSCGVQYNSSEAKNLLVEIAGKVQIDHTEELENNIKRAERFEQSGNYNKSKEYYDRALDIDADNSVAKSNMERIEEYEKFKSYYVVPAAVDPKQNVKNFLKKLFQKHV